MAASSFRASYVVLSRQSDFIGALRVGNGASPLRGVFVLFLLLHKWVAVPKMLRQAWWLNRRLVPCSMTATPLPPHCPLAAHYWFRAPHPQASRDFAAAASERLGLRVFPYSIFHIFFEQYLTIGGEALTLLGSGELRFAHELRTTFYCARSPGVDEGAVDSSS